VRLRPAQGQHRGGRRLPDGRREQLRGDGLRAAHRRRAAHGGGRGRGREAAVPPARRHARQLVLGGGDRRAEGRSMIGNAMNRRAFIGGAALAAGGITVSAAMPWTSAPVGAEQPTLATLTDWSVDDMWGVYPRYAERIDYPRP